MSLTYGEKISIFDTYEIFRKDTIKPDKINYYHKESKNKRKVVVRELRETGNGYIFAGYIEDYKDKVDNRGFINMDKYANNEDELRALLDRVINLLSRY